VTLPRLTRLEASGASRVDAAPTGDDLELVVSGASTVTLTGPGKVTSMCPAPAGPTVRS